MNNRVFKAGPGLHHAGGDFTTLFLIYVCIMNLGLGR